MSSGLSLLSAPDRSFVTDLVYGTLRNARYLDACLAPLLKKPENLPVDIRTALQLGSYEILVRGTPRRAAVNEWVGEAKDRYGKLSGLVNAVLRRVETRDDLAPAVRYSVPDWLFAEWSALFGRETAQAVAQGMLEPEPLWLTTYHEEAVTSLASEGCEVTPGPLSGTLAVRPSKALSELSAFQAGWVQPQNPSSTVPVRVLEVKPGERALDLASGNGIKAAQLAATGANVTSVELDAKKLERARKNLARLGFEVDTLAYDLRTLPALEPAPKVLLDAPCSGTGTLRGNPEIRGRLTEQAVNDLAALQNALLVTAARLTQPGGTLVYAVCALTQAETVARVERFLAAQPDFSLEPLTTPLPSSSTPQGSFILPVGGLDGFFIAKLKRS